MSNNTSKSIEVEHQGHKFGFSHDPRGNGYWYCLSPRTTIYGSGIGCVVPRQYWADLIYAAVKQGVDTSIFYSSKKVTSQKSTTNSSQKARTAKSSSPKDEGGIKIF